MDTPVALVLGGHGLLGRALMHQLAVSGWTAHSLTREECNLLDPVELRERIEFIAPNAILNAAAWTDIEAAEKHPEEALSLNRGLPALLGSLVKGTDIHLIHYSSALVFNGKKDTPYTEEDRPDPLSTYARTKLAGEAALQELKLDNCCIIRTSCLFGPGRKDIVKSIIELARSKNEIKVVHDITGSPTYTPDLAKASLNLLEKKATGLFHVVNGGQASWCDLAAETIRLANIPSMVRGISEKQWPHEALRPSHAVLSMGKYAACIGSALRPWPQALRDYVFTSGRIPLPSAP